MHKIPEIMTPPNNNTPPQGYKMTELGALPEDWEVERLGENTKLLKGKKPKLLFESLQEGSIPYLTAEYFRTGRASKFVLKEENDFIGVYKDEIVFIWDGSNAGDVFIGLDGALASTMIKIIPDNSIYPIYLYYFLKTTFEFLNTKTTGSTIPHINKNLFNNLLFPLPPLPEQQKIAAVLSAVQEAKEKTQAVIEAAKALKKSMMKHIFTYGPVSPQEAENVPLKETEIGPVPEDWEVVKLENIFRITSGKTRPKILKESLSEPYIFPVFGGNGILGYSNEFLIEYPTIILGRVGEYCGSVHISQGKCWVSDNALYVNYFQKKIDLKFLLNALEILNLNKLKNRGGQPLISQSIVYSQSIPLPPLHIQQKIASILSAIDAKIEAEENKKKSLEELFKSLLHNLMTAKIRVNKLEITL